MSAAHEDRDRSFALAQRATDLMRDYGPSATPQAYTVWYTYVAGTHPLLNDAVKRLTASGNGLTEADVEELHDTYFGGRRLTVAAEQMGASMLAEIGSVREMLDVSLGSTAQYGESLNSLSQDLAAAALTRARMREIVSALVANTREMSANNRTLEARMRESRVEIESLRETLEATRIESLTDPLTGLANRKQFEAALGACVEEAAARREPASLVVLDIDTFKRFNDTYGHLTGDQVLRLVAIVMREQVKGTATLARFGGEEFGIVLPGVDRVEAREIAERVRTAVMGRELIKRSSGESLGKVTISLGLATWRPGEGAVALLERADLCMFAAKRAGRNRTMDDGGLEASVPRVA